MRKIITLSIFFLSTISVFTKNQASTTVFTSTTAPTTSPYKIDTLYYDKNWKGCPVAAFADYMCITVTPEDSIYAKKFRIYNITGELLEDSGFISIDPLDGNNIVCEGKCVRYYKSGEVRERVTYAHGMPNGEYIKYYENGLIQEQGYLIDNKRDGIYTKFTEDGKTCNQYEFTNGEFKNPYYTVTLPDGCNMRFLLADNTPMLEAVTTDELKSKFQNGLKWWYYIKNGVALYVSASRVKDYGRYIQLNIYLENNSPLTFDFDPAQTMANFFIERNNRQTYSCDVKALSATEYLKQVKRSQNWNEAISGIAMGISAAAAGYSSATINSSANARASYNGNTAYASGYSTTRISTYNNAAAFQASMIAGEHLDRQTDANRQAREIRNEGYIKINTMYPGDRVVGYLNIPKDAFGHMLRITIPVNTIEHEFFWVISELDKY